MNQSRIFSFIGLLLSIFAVATSGAAEQERLLHLRAATVDPRLESRAEAGPDRYALIQLSETDPARVRRRLAAMNLELLGYVPDGAWLVRLSDSAQLPALLERAEVRYAAPRKPEHRIDPELLAPWSGTLEIDVTLFNGELEEPFLEALTRSVPQARLMARNRREPHRFRLSLNASERSAVLSSLSRDPRVAWIERHRPLELHNDQSIWIGQSYDRISGPGEANSASPALYSQSAPLWQNGLHGEGQIIGIADTGIEYDSCFFDDPSSSVTPQSVAPPGALSLNLSHRKILAVNDANGSGFNLDGTFRHGTHVSGSAAGDDLTTVAFEGFAGHDPGDGMAPAARIVFEDVSLGQNSQCSTSIFVPSIGNLLEQEYLAGARISTNSFGSGSGAYTSSSSAVDLFAWEHDDMAVIFSAGNGGVDGITSYAAAKNVISVGASETWNVEKNLDPEHLTRFSSRGPTDDGRIKPDVLAPGAWVTSNRFATLYIDDTADPACDGGNPDVCFPSFGGCYVTDTSESCSTSVLSGTSMSAPTTAGLTALVRQYFTEGFYPTGASQPGDARAPSAALLKAVLINGARSLTGLDKLTGVSLGDSPAPDQGWGRVMLDDALFFPGDSRKTILIDRANDAGLAHAESESLTVAVQSSQEPLKLTLVWSDPPAQPFSAITLINDLDLELTAPDGTRFHGNQWTSDNIHVTGDKVSSSDPVERDTRNNVEGILLAAPVPGAYTVTVRASNVPGHPSLSTQGFALVVTGDVTDSSLPTVPPVPDGRFGTAMRADRNGPEIELHWDLGDCPAPDYHLLFGDLAEVSSLAPTGATCLLGQTGQATWSGVPAGSLWFLLVGEDGLTREGSWGLDSGLETRNPGLSSGFCGMIQRQDGVCP